MTSTAKDKPPESADSRIGLIGTSLWGGGKEVGETPPLNSQLAGSTLPRLRWTATMTATQPGLRASPSPEIYTPHRVVFECCVLKCVYKTKHSPLHGLSLPGTGSSSDNPRALVAASLGVWRPTNPERPNHLTSWLGSRAFT